MRYLVIVLLSISLLGAWAQDKETLYQVSTINALLQGIYDGDTTVATLLKQGDFGLGTFTQLDGEMLVLDGVCYQIRSDGAVTPMSGTATTPFAAVTSFEPDLRLPVMEPSTFAEIEAMVDTAVGTMNRFYAVKVTGEFARVKARSVPKQQAPYPLLVEVVKTQPLFDLQGKPGTLVGFRCPPFVQGLNVPGFHFHFISDDKKSGGHVLDCILVHGVVEIDVTPTLTLSLPSTAAFQQADLTKDRPGDLEKVEK